VPADQRERRMDRHLSSEGDAMNERRERLLGTGCVVEAPGTRMTAEGSGLAERLLSEREVKDLTSLSRVVRWRLVKQGKFPAPVAISPGRVATPLSAVQRWISERIAEAGGHGAE